MLWFVFQISAAHNTDGAMRKDTTFVERTMSFRCSFINDYQGDKSNFRSGEISQWKIDQCGRFDIVSADVTKHDTEFQLAFQNEKIWDQLIRIFEMHKKGELSGMKAPGPADSARQASKQFKEKAELKSTCFKSLNSLITDEVKECILASVLLGNKTLTQMNTDFVLHKNLNYTRKVLAWLADCEGDWDKCLAMFLPQFTSEKALTNFASSVAQVPLKILNLAMASRDGALRHAPVSLKNWVLRANVARGATVVTDNVQSKSWEKMSTVERRALRTIIQNFRGESFGHKLLDGTSLSEKMDYKVLQADSCDRNWTGNAAALARATEDLAVARNDFRVALELQVDSVPPGLDPPSGIPPPHVLPAAEISRLGEFLDDVPVARRRQVLGRFQGVHLVRRRDDPRLEGALLVGRSYIIIENDMLIC